ncbi:TRAP transporter small permease [Marinomonas sp. 15G1-11]|uniref:TRAP transporter small permease protein n=1 Tax=Marinomonas phaeophyticola TaxID=3004091 RepID=A0ABT4JRN9_9GAMM|nr:TRAP transporter small permease [Marinomonas sp. 15G1-11]MCZ2720915.1 TRAP transporter small permease [Marinomonas sp. 15G1-11]
MSRASNKTMSNPSDSEPLNLVDESQIEEPLDFKMIDLPVMILFWVLMCIVFLQFFTRYILNDSLAWTEEIARFLLVLVGFVGSITAVRKGSHIFLEFLYRFIPSSLAKVLSVFSEVVCVGFYGACAWMSSQIALQTHQTLVSVELPKSYLYWVIAFCFVAMSLYSIGKMVMKMKLSHHQIVSNIEEQATSV